MTIETIEKKHIDTEIPISNALLISIGGLLCVILLGPFSAIVWCVIGLYIAPPKGYFLKKIEAADCKNTNLLKMFLVYFVFMFIGIIVTTTWAMLLTYWGIDFAKKQEIFNLFPQLSAFSKVMIVLRVIIIVPIYEEIIFRRCLFRVFEPLGQGSAIILTSLIFSACHMFLLGFPLLFLLGVTLQWVYLKYRGLKMAIFLHFLVNLFSICQFIIFQN